MQKVLHKLISFLKPGGRLLVADFALPQGNMLSKSFQRFYYRTANVFYWLLGLAHLHDIYDYKSYFASNNLLEENSEIYKYFAKFACFENIIARKQNTAGQP
jgi:ubiquinone/menaquinone biosynthesis C-methylase UbiE